MPCISAEAQFPIPAIAILTFAISEETPNSCRLNYCVDEPLPKLKLKSLALATLPGSDVDSFLYRSAREQFESQKDNK